MKCYNIHTMDGNVRFNGREVATEQGNFLLPNRLRAKLRVTVYVSDRAEGVIRQEVTIAGVTGTFINVVQLGTSPEWGSRHPREAKVLNRAWAKACAAEPALRPVRDWKLPKSRETRIPTGENTYMCVRTSEWPDQM